MEFYQSETGWAAAWNQLATAIAVKIAIAAKILKAGPLLPIIRILSWIAWFEAAIAARAAAEFVATLIGIWLIAMLVLMMDAVQGEKRQQKNTRKVFVIKGLAWREPS
jgi:hypothetical protein